jgi:hypothetical protein
VDILRVMYQTFGAPLLLPMTHPKKCGSLSAALLVAHHLCNTCKFGQGGQDAAMLLVAHQNIVRYTWSVIIWCAMGNMVLVVHHIWCAASTMTTPHLLVARLSPPLLLAHFIYFRSGPVLFLLTSFPPFFSPILTS